MRASLDTLYCNIISRRCRPDPERPPFRNDLARHSRMIPPRVLDASGGRLGPLLWIADGGTGCRKRERPCAKCAANPECGRRAVSALFRGEVGEIIDYALRLPADFLLR